MNDHKINTNFLKGWHLLKVSFHLKYSITHRLLKTKGNLSRNPFLLCLLSDEFLLIMKRIQAIEPKRQHFLVIFRSID